MKIDNSSVNYGYLTGRANVDVEPHRQNDRFLPFVVLTHVNSGEGCFEYDGKTYVVYKDETMYVPECVLHNVCSTKPHNVSWAHISASSSKYDFMKNVRAPVIIRGESSLIIRDYINKLATIKYDSVSSLFERDNCISGIFLELSKYTDNKIVCKEKPLWVIKLLDHISIHIKEKFNLDMLAQELFTSKSSLCHKFKKEVGVSLIDYILQEKIKASFYMLADGMNNSQIATELNFSDEFYFSKIFKKSVGISPKEYKNTYVVKK